MDDLIRRKALLEKATDVTIGEGDEAVHYYGISVYDVKTAPAVDAVEVVRCEDCVMHNNCGFEQAQGLKGFCSYGERKENETD